MDVLSSVIGSIRLGEPKFTHTHRAPGWGNRYGPYPGAGFHLVLSGSCWLIRDDAPALRLQAGDVLLLPHGSQHGLGDHPGAAVESLPPDVGEGAVEAGAAAPSDDGVELLCGAYRLDRRLPHPLLASLPDVVHLGADTRDHEFRAVVGLLVDELHAGRAGAEISRTALLDLMLVHLLRAWLEARAIEHPERGWAAALADPVLATALRHVHGDPAHPWTVGELAERSGLSRTAFARRFTRTLGRPPMSYVTWWRLQSGARLLSGTDLPLAQISRAVGYTSEFAFATAFRREFGTAPGRYRREQHEVDGSDHDSPPRVHRKVR